MSIHLSYEAAIRKFSTAKMAIIGEYYRFHQFALSAEGRHTRRTVSANLKPGSMWRVAPGMA